MASAVRRKNGCWEIRLVCPDGKRRSIYLGHVSRKFAVEIATRLQRLCESIRCAQPDGDIYAWLSGIDDQLHAKIAKCGMVKPRARTAATLDGFFTELFGQMNVKASTMEIYGHTRRCLVEFMGAKQPLRAIDVADADKWRAWLISDQKLSPATVSRRVGLARMFFAKAADWELIRKNPFADVATGSQANASRQFFVTREMAGKVLDAMPDPEWRLIFLLARYGGMRVPSEPLMLKWEDVDFEKKRMRVFSPKLERHEDKKIRITPIFPELYKPLLEAFEGSDGSPHVIVRMRNKVANLRTQLDRFIERAGLTPWAKSWNNLRSTRQTELSEIYPDHVVCAWLGNSPKVAKDHYLQLLDDHYARASAPHRTHHQNTEQPCTSTQQDSAMIDFDPDFAGGCIDVQGFEDVTIGRGRTRTNQELPSRTQTTTDSTPLNTPLETDPAKLAEEIAILPIELRRRIAAFIERSKTSSGVKRD